MASDEEEGQSPSRKDRVIDDKTFQMGGGIDFSGFIDEETLSNVPKPVREGASPTDATIPPSPEKELLPPLSNRPNEIDEAVGEIFDPFDEDSGSKAGDVLRDGTVMTPPEIDTVTEIAVEGEKRLHWGIMVSMIFVYSLIGYVVATALSPMLAAAGLVILATMGFLLGERWVPDKAMHLLGVTWVIISMKLLYGLALDAHHWGWISTPVLGVVLLSLVGVNIAVAYRHNHDAIAAQATLVLLAIASATGLLLGEAGIAAMILLATLLLHGLAIHRKSGNLASLGIAASHLWVGFHAIQLSPLKIGALTILPLADPMLLFLLALAIAAVNGAMAARFSKSENWFSQGLGSVGLGRPGLWGVSVGLGMIGAMMLLASERDTTGYALGLLMTLLAVYGGSYLVVRGVSAERVLKPLLAALPLLLIVLLGQELWTTSPIPLSGYEIFTIFAAVLTVFVLLRDQESVTDRVLWLGTVVIIILLTILIPARSASDGGDEGVLLLSSLAVLQIATAFLAIRRKSPSLAGVTILAPWAWMLLHRFWFTTIGAFSSARGISVDSLQVIILDETAIAIFLIFSALLQYPINIRLGETGVNLAGRLIGATELSARLRDSGMMRLWNLGLLSGLIVWLTNSVPGEVNGWGVIAGLGTLALVHVVAEAQGKHQGNPRTILILLAITFVILQWKAGLDAIWMLILTAVSMTIILTREREDSGPVLSLGMTLLGMQIALFALNRFTVNSLVDPEPLNRLQTGFVVLACTAALLAIYLPIASRLKDLLRPAVATLALLSITIWASWSDQSHWSASGISLVLFAGSGLWLAAQGEIRNSVSQMGKRDERIAAIQRRQQTVAALSSGDFSELDPTVAGLLEMSTTAPSDSGEESALPMMAAPSSQLSLDSVEEGAALDQKIQGRVYHFADETLASLASADATGETVRAFSQAVSIGQVKMSDAQLYSLLDKQRKRRRRAGAHGGDEHLDLLVGDIHHKPLIVLSFIVVTALAATFTAFTLSAVAAGVLLITSIFALALSLVSRWRAKAVQLSLPDLFGIEMPFAVTMIALGIIYLAGHLGPLGSTWNQLDLIVLSSALIALAGLSLTGRHDLAWRIPSALEAVVLVLLMTRLLGFVLYGAAPMPLSVDPLAASTTGGVAISIVEWTIPWLYLECLLLGLVLVWDWIEGVRRKRGMPDHRGAAGRGAWALSVVLLSTGPAGLLAGALCLRRSFQWQQPAAAAISIHVVLASLFAFTNWVDVANVGDLLGWIILAVAVSMVTAHILTIALSKPHWTTAWMWNAHLLLPFAVFILTGFSGWLILSILVLSLTTWVGGILQLRRGMRVFGAFDLGLSVMAWILVLQGSLLDPQMLLLMLLSLGVVLGVVAWLGTRHQEQMGQD
uniref:Uncharacterized protein n=1 Tax=uncultured marine group II/III euryarchaeote KM3_182_B06 TaxID=1457946 RepID=A0A075GU97_9EURY|nr:hypothetical protein [uncultured marine group II/III euryarchaeote KM3_182_B06]